MKLNKKENSKVYLAVVPEKAQSILGCKIGICPASTPERRVKKNLCDSTAYRPELCMKVMYDDVRVKWTEIDKMWKSHFKDKMISDLGKNRTEWFQITKSDFVAFAKEQRRLFGRERVSILEIKGDKTKVVR